MFAILYVMFILCYLVNIMGKVTCKILIIIMGKTDMQDSDTYVL